MICTCAALIACEATRLCRLPRALGWLPLRLARRSAEQEGRGMWRDAGAASIIPAGWSAPHPDGQSATYSCAARPRVPAASLSRHTADQPVITCLDAVASPESPCVRRTDRPAAVEVHADERRRGLMARTAERRERPVRRRSMPMGAARRTCTAAQTR